VRDSVPFWKRERSALDRTARTMRRGSPESVAELASRLTRIGALARGAGETQVVTAARSLARALASARAIARDRELLSRLERLGVLTAEAATALDAGWEELSRDRVERARRRARGRAMRRLRRALAGASRNDRKIRNRLEASLRKLVEKPSPSGNAAPRDLRRYRSILRRRTILESAVRPAPASSPTASSRGPDELLERWHSARRFRKRLERERRSAERRGAVTLVLQLDRAVASLERSIDAARRAALREAPRASNNVVYLRARTG
jgi:hypothetical protein